MPHRRAAVAGRPPFHLPQRAPALGYFARRRCPGLRAQRARSRFRISKRRARHYSR